MQAIPRSPFVRSVVIPLTLIGWLSGCYKWSTVDMSPSEVVNGELPEQVRVTWRGEQYELTSPTIQADSLIGWDSDQRMVILTGEIESFEVREGDDGATIGLIVGVLAGLVVASVALLWIAFATAEWCEPFGSASCS